EYQIGTEKVNLPGTARAVDVRAVAVSSSDRRAMERHLAAGIRLGPRWTVDWVEADDQSLYIHLGVPFAVLEDPHNCAPRVPGGRFARTGRRFLSRCGHGTRRCGVGAHATIVGHRLNRDV